MKHHITDLPDEFYEIANEVAEDLLPELQAEIENLADEYDMPTALAIGGAAIIYLICGLGNTYDDQMGAEPYQAANEELARAVSEALNQRITASVSRANGELN